MDMAIFNSGIQDYSMPKHGLYLTATLNKRYTYKTCTQRERGKKRYEIAVKHRG